jgi:hypothetical protein
VSAVQGKINGLALLRHNNTVVVRHEGVEQLQIPVAQQHAHYNPLETVRQGSLFLRPLHMKDYPVVIFPKPVVPTQQGVADVSTLFQTVSGPR